MNPAGETDWAEPRDEQSAYWLDPNSDSVLSQTQIEACGPMNEEACQVFHKVNKVRLNAGLHPLRGSLNCAEAAQSHAEDMHLNNYFSHHGLNETWDSRMERFQVPPSRSENISRSSSAEESVRLWMNSAGHRENILDKGMLYTGVGYHRGYWVQCFSSRP